MRRIAALLALAILPATALAQQTPTWTLSGDVPDDGNRFFLLPFEVPAGAVEIEVRHDDLSEANILDWGLNDPNGWRGWGGGNAEPAIVGIDAASRSYKAGALPAGTWNVVVGKAKIEAPPGQYHVEVFVRTSNATLAAQTERAPYVAAAALETGPRWYAGDFHVHSIESGDARPPLDEVATFARGRGLDFVALSDHNTNSQVEFIADAQSRHPDLLFIPSVEWTSYAGHANAIGATEWVDHKVGFGNLSFDQVGQAYRDQGALLSINHPNLEVGNSCIGCGWNHAGAGPWVGAVEIATGGWSQSGFIFGFGARQFWDAMLDEGHHLAAIGGSDDHRAGVDLSAYQSPIGDPTTMVYAEELSVAAILEGIRNGRTVVKLQGPDDPMIELSSEQPIVGDTVTAARARFVATVTGGAGDTFRWVVDGEEGEPIAIAGDPWTTSIRLEVLPQEVSRVRAQVFVDGDPRTVTSHLWLASDGTTPPGDGSGCRCAFPGRATAGALAPAFLALALLVRRRKSVR